MKGLTFIFSVLGLTMLHFIADNFVPAVERTDITCSEPINQITRSPP